MIIKTKKYALKPSTYIKFCFLNIIKQQWFIPFSLILITVVLFGFKLFIWSILPIVFFILYILFWLAQLYSMTQLEQNSMLFSKTFYQISPQQLVICFSTKQGHPFPWKQVSSAKRGKNYFIIFLSKAQFIYLPYKVFHKEQDIELLALLLKGKNLI